MDEHAIREIIRQELAGSITQSRMGGRAMVQVTGLDKEAFSDIEMLQPHGISGLPKPGADVLIIGMAGRKDGALALFADMQGEHLADAQPGDKALCNGTAHVALRESGGIEIMSIGETLRHLVTEAFMELFNTHTHPVSGDVTEAPTQQMNATHLTTTVQAGGT
jgi:phage gp45-like